MANIATSFYRALPTPGAAAAAAPLDVYPGTEGMTKLVSAVTPCAIGKYTSMPGRERSLGIAVQTKANPVARERKRANVEKDSIEWHERAPAKHHRDGG